MKNIKTKLAAMVMATVTAVSVASVSVSAGICDELTNDDFDLCYKNIIMTKYTYSDYEPKKHRYGGFLGITGGKVCSYEQRNVYATDYCTDGHDSITRTDTEDKGHDCGK